MEAKLEKHLTGGEITSLLFFPVMRFSLVILVASCILTSSGYRVRHVSAPNGQHSPLLHSMRLDAQKTNSESDGDATSAAQTIKDHNLHQMEVQGAGNRGQDPSTRADETEQIVSSQLAGSAMFGLLGSLLLTHDAYPVLISAASTAIASKQKGILSDYLRDVGSSTYNLITELYGVLSKEKAIVKSGSTMSGDHHQQHHHQQQQQQQQQHERQQQVLPSLELLLATAQNADSLEERITNYCMLESFLKEEKQRIEAAIEADKLRAAQLFQQRTSFLSSLTANLHQVDKERVKMVSSSENEHRQKEIESEKVSKEEILQSDLRQIQQPVEQLQQQIQFPMHQQAEQYDNFERQSEQGFEQVQQVHRSKQLRQIEQQAPTQKDEIQQNQPSPFSESDGSLGIGSISDFQLILADHERLSGKDITLEDRFEALSVLVSHMGRTSLASELMSNLTIAYTNLKNMEGKREATVNVDVSDRKVQVKTALPLSSVAPELTLHAVPNIPILVRDPMQIDSGVQPHRDDHIVQPAAPARNIREALYRGTTPEYTAIYDRMYRGIHAHHRDASEEKEERKHDFQVRSAVHEDVTDRGMSNVDTNAIDSKRTL